MFDAKKLLDRFLGGGQGGIGLGNRSGGSGMGDLLGGLGGSGLGGMLGGGGFGRGALTGGLAGLLLGSGGGRMGGSIMRLGGLALIGTLAYKAFRSWQAGQQPATAQQATDSQQGDALALPPSGTPFNPSGEGEQQSLGRSLLRAMIAAAKADGRVEAAEQASIFAEMDKLDLNAEDKAFVIDELRGPLDVDTVAKGARSPEEAAQLYTASLLAIDVDNPAERGYLALLAARLNLDPKLVEHLHATTEGIAPTAGEPVVTAQTS
jgi:uncharacterized membrane protein YebE (DUF533 family)